MDLHKKSSLLLHKPLPHSNVKVITGQCDELLLSTAPSANILHLLGPVGASGKGMAVAYLAKGPTYNRAADTVWLGQVQLVFACITVPFAPGNPGHCIAGLMHRHITPLPITQQDLIPA